MHVDIFDQILRVGEWLIPFIPTASGVSHPIFQSMKLIAAPSPASGSDLESPMHFDITFAGLPSNEIGQLARPPST